MGGQRDPRPSVARLQRLRVSLDEDYCREVAAYYQRAPRRRDSPGLRRSYEMLKQHSRLLYRSAVAAGFAVEPWRGDGPPYRDSRDLRERVTATRRLRVLPTAVGHGPPSDTGAHPLREPSGVRVRGEDVPHNDLFRAVHDLFGHVMFGHGFGPAGEFAATRVQGRLYPPEAWPALFTEQVGQTCWFFYGPHRSVPAPRRPYPDQKVFAFPDPFLDAFAGLFRFEEDPG
ncbi:crotonobetainyl-CoA--carnitine CoA-transferase [Actinomadura sp. WMMB 499]|nr:crotonobetainyl-CoA--carnitine CoA-transferase [Actinomadura sp. WMMB 499]